MILTCTDNVTLYNSNDFVCLCYLKSMFPSKKKWIYYLSYFIKFSRGKRFSSWWQCNLKTFVLICKNFNKKLLFVSNPGQRDIARMRTYSFDHSFVVSTNILQEQVVKFLLGILDDDPTMMFKEKRKISYERTKMCVETMNN